MDRRQVPGRMRKAPRKRRVGTEIIMAQMFYSCKGKMPPVDEIGYSILTVDDL